MKRGSAPSTPERDRRSSDSLNLSPNKMRRIEDFFKMKDDWTIDNLFTPDRDKDLTGIEFPKISHAKLLIDTREPWKDDIVSILKTWNIDCEFKSLECGDYMWVGDRYTFDCCIERKTVDDLRKSLGDSRFESQSSNMKKYKMHNLFYLVEGQNPREEDLERIRKEKFKIIRTNDINDTFEFLVNVTVMLNRYIRDNDYRKLFFILSKEEDERRGPFVNYKE